MKKNLRIASAAAAALLAVAPVAASAVTAHADVSFDQSQNNTPSASNSVISVNVSLGNITNKKVSDIEKDAKVTANVNGTNYNVPAGYSVKIYQVASDSSTAPTAVPADQTGLTHGKYIVEVTGLNIDGLPNNISYTAQSGDFVDANHYNSASTTAAIGASFTGTGQSYSDSFTVNDSKLKGTPYFYKTDGSSNSQATSGSVSVNPTNGKVSLSSIRDAVEAAYDVKVDAGAATGNDVATVDLTNSDIDSAVKTALSKANLTLDSNNEFSTPANSLYNVDVTVTASNGKTATLPITVTFGKSEVVQGNYPKMSLGSTNWYGTKDSNIYSPTANDKWASIGVNGKVDTDAIEKAFSAAVNDNDATTLPVSVDSSKVNTAVAGTYPVTVSAKNPAGYTTKVTFNLVVGVPGAKYQSVKQDGNVYSINGNKVNQTNDTVKAGDNIATFDTVTVDGKEYVRINKSDSNQFVDASIFTKPAEEKTVSETVMYKSAIYNKDGKTTGKHISGYTDTDFAAGKDGKAEEVTINGSKFLKLAGDKGYVRTRNVFGSEMTLKHNAYAYKSNGRRANRKLYKKGTKITVYGGQYRAIRHYRKNAVRIGHNRYIKVVNVNYKLAD